MPTSYILINSDLGTDESTIDELKEEIDEGLKACYKVAKLVAEGDDIPSKYAEKSVP